MVENVSEVELLHGSQLQKDQREVQEGDPDVCEAKGVAVPLRRQTPDGQVPAQVRGLHEGPR